MLQLALSKRCLLGMAVFSMLSTFAHSAESTLRVMTYNVRYASDKQPNAWSERIPVAAAMLDEYHPDVIGMQECLYRQVKDLAAVLPDFAWIGLGRDGGSRGEFMAVFYRSSRLEPLAFDHFWLSATPQQVGSTTWGNSNRRMVTWVQFRDRQTGAAFYLMNTHFDHRIQLAREKSAELVLRRAAALTDLPVIVTGDFNAPAGSSRVYRTLVQADGFDDTWTSAARRGEESGTFHGFSGVPRDDQRIDWILTRGPVTTRYTEIVTYHTGNQFPSDHFPVIADVVIEHAAENP